MVCWRQLQGFSDYAVSSDGCVRRITPSKGTKPGRILQPHYNKYAYVRLAVARNCVKKVYVHRLVAMAFIGCCPKGKEVNHKDSDPRNNSAGNLEYATRSENCLHAHRNGKAHRFPSKEAHPLSKLTNQQVGVLRRMAKRGTKSSVLAKKFGVTAGHVRKIVRGDVR